MGGTPATPESDHHDTSPACPHCFCRCACRTGHGLRRGSWRPLLHATAHRLRCASSPPISTAARLRCMATRWPHRPAILDAGTTTAMTGANASVPTVNAKPNTSAKPSEREARREREARQAREAHREQDARRDRERDQARDQARREQAQRDHANRPQRDDDRRQRGDGTHRPDRPAPAPLANRRPTRPGQLRTYPRSEDFFRKTTMPIVRNCLAACAVLVCFTAQAQVLRCTDARTGQVTYTDGTCPRFVRSSPARRRKKSSSSVSRPPKRWRASSSNCSGRSGHPANRRRSRRAARARTGGRRPAPGCAPAGLCAVCRVRPVTSQP